MKINIILIFCVLSLSSCNVSQVGPQVVTGDGNQTTGAKIDQKNPVTTTVDDPNVAVGTGASAGRPNGTLADEMNLPPREEKKE